MLLYLDSSLMDVFDLIGIFLHSSFLFLNWTAVLNWICDYCGLKKLTSAFAIWILSQFPLDWKLWWDYGILIYYTFAIFRGKTTFWNPLTFPATILVTINMHKILIFVSWLIFVHPPLFFLLIMTWNLSRFLPSSFNAQRRLTTILKFRFPILLCSFCNNIICHWRIPYLASATKV